MPSDVPQDADTGAPAPRRRGRPLSEATSEQLRAAARSVFAERGWEGFTIAEVERRTGVRRSAIYRRWPTAHALLFDAMFSTIDGAVPLPSTGSAAGDIREGMLAFAARLREPGAVAAARAVAAAMLTDESTRARWEAAMDVDRQSIASVFADGAERGEQLPDLPSTVLADLFIAWIVYRCVIRGPVPTDLEIEQLVEGILRA